METFNVIGLMSGTSLDGLDIAFCRFNLSQNNWNFEIVNGKTYHYNEELLKKLKQAHNFSAMQLMQLDAELAHLFSACIQQFIADYNVKPDFISSHGHTVFHQPLKAGINNTSIPFTTQIANGAIISALTGYDVVSDFRTADVALGGQGAPLVPVGDEKLFHQFQYCLNLGGIANISFNKTAAHTVVEPVNNTRVASDLCFVNIALNYLAAIKGLSFDDGGSLARKGKLNIALLDGLNNLEFNKRPFPKSIGKEYFEAEVAPLFDQSKISVADKLHTCCEHIAIQIMNCITNAEQTLTIYNSSQSRILITGGGAYNDFLVELLSKKITAEIVIPENKIIEFKEALIFAFLGVLRIRGEVNVLSSVTGAKNDSCSGAVYKATMV